MGRDANSGLWIPPRNRPLKPARNRFFQLLAASGSSWELLGVPGSVWEHLESVLAASRAAVPAHIDAVLAHGAAGPAHKIAAPGHKSLKFLRKNNNFELSSFLR